MNIILVCCCRAQVPNNSAYNGVLLESLRNWLDFMCTESQGWDQLIDIDEEEGTGRGDGVGSRQQTQWGAICRQ
jgi:hypothetical protein